MKEEKERGEGGQGRRLKKGNREKGRRGGEGRQDNTRQVGKKKGFSRYVTYAMVTYFQDY